ncbi:uncharacterized protein LOC132195166 isoform X2 [Neocloeon triangulifer]|uniref:uncharacterized protein LOC132195166 isoform X2 n=1 Tax=Neocloeon triangulifer TaxID=2078957 RepID=UPI00286F8A7D|nr:uncharacterized protein LOC132195166 isoform X2 [Neocloeon triangulifer]
MKLSAYYVIFARFIWAIKGSGTPWDPETVKELYVTFPKFDRAESPSDYDTVSENYNSLLQPVADIEGAEIMQPIGAGKWTKRIINDQIIGGKEATKGQFPWQAFLIMDKSFLCGGSLILTDWILTAAHCAFGNTDFEVHLGLISREQNNASLSTTLTTSTKFIHEYYNPETLQNDIALVKLPIVVKLSDFIKLVKLPAASASSTTFEGLFATVSGFGKTNDECLQFYGSNIISSSNLCTSSDDGKATCQGDSGGPLVYQAGSNSWVQIGIVSFGSAEGCLFGPTGFVRVSSYLGWILSYVGPDVSGDITSINTNAAPKVTSAKPPKKSDKMLKNCRRSDFKRMQSCCENPPKELVPFNRQEKICSNSKAKMSIFNEYTLNKGQHSKVNYSVFFYDVETQDYMRHQACFVNCYLSKKHVIVDEERGTLNSTAFVELLMKNQVDENWASKIATSFNECESLLQEYQIPYVESFGKWCNATAAAIVQCTQFQLLQLCDSYKTNKNCGAKRSAFNSCAVTAFKGQLIKNFK